MKVLFSLVATTLLIAGCAAAPSSKSQAQFEGRTPAYREGYLAGCDYGRAEASGAKDPGTRDEARIQSESSYANGWFNGMEYCRDNYRPSSGDYRHDPTKPIRTEGGW